MISRFFSTFVDDPAFRSWKQSRVGQICERHTTSFIDHSQLNQLPATTRDTLLRDQQLVVFHISKSEIPFRFYRSELSFAATQYADLKCLCLTRQDKSKPAFKSRFISGNLSPYIGRAASYDETVKVALSHTHDLTEDELLNIISAVCLTADLRLQGLNVVRREFEDVTEGASDWFCAYIQSMMICREHQHRVMLGLAQLVRGELQASQHLALCELVRIGSPKPLMDWESRFHTRHELGPTRWRDPCT